MQIQRYEYDGARRRASRLWRRVTTGQGDGLGGVEEHERAKRDLEEAGQAGAPAPPAMRKCKRGANVKPRDTEGQEVIDHNPPSDIRDDFGPKLDICQHQRAALKKLYIRLARPATTSMQGRATASRSARGATS